ncbi:hypothetical protein J2S74_002835 [Evansella vedderi]|uniref:Uncharacterized protein n=1 Tax=Evansella vedderi TaxID=38282 RepID=A0ABT9ZW36_9BACI|nr:hypothetical protein [Evansella vedderi]MDQ0255453.1 hypothetical protein [Evansella vedderi]
MAIAAINSYEELHEKINKTDVLEKNAICYTAHIINLVVTINR